MPKRTSDQLDEPRFDGSLAASGGYGLPGVRTLSDEYRDVAEPEDSEWVPPIQAPGLVRRVLARLMTLVREARWPSD
jgi:hypothetical protein